MMDGAMGSMMGWMMGIGLLGWVLVIALLVAILLVLLRLLNERKSSGGPGRTDGRTTDPSKNP
jgi:uncharacterized membrane protein